MKTEKKPLTSDTVWFVSRWFLGAVIDLALLLAAVMMAWTHVQRGLEELTSPLLAIITGFGAFAAGMAGKAWMRIQVWQHILPEVIEQTRNKK